MCLFLFHSEFMECASCGFFDGKRVPPFRLQAHHIFGKARRFDLRCNLLMLCEACHANVYGNLEVVLWLKWAVDRDGTEWEKLTIIRGSFLPEPREGDLRTGAGKRRTA